MVKAIFCNLSFTAEFPPKPHENPTTLAEYLENRKVELRLTWDDVSRLTDSSKQDLWEWRKGVTPRFGKWQHILNFLGEDPFRKDDSLAERLKSYRRRHGLSKEKMIAKLKMGIETYREAESGECREWIRERCERLIGEE